MNDSQYKYLMSELVIRKGEDTWNEFQVQSDNAIVIEGKKVYVEFTVTELTTEFFKIVGIRREENLVKITLAMIDAEVLAKMSAEG